MPPNILDRIVATKRLEIAAAKLRVQEALLEAGIADLPPCRGFAKALRVPGELTVIAEVKKASPSAGVIRADFDPVQIARIYERHGAAALSVLTDETYFQGHLDYLRAPQLATVYERAQVFVFPSLYEGFGFPLLEAMARGVPSIAARSSSLPEIGGDAALYFEPGDPRSLAAQISRVLNDGALREDLATRGRARAAEFRWERAAAETLAVLRRAAG